MIEQWILDWYRRYVETGILFKMFSRGKRRNVIQNWLDFVHDCIIKLLKRDAYEIQDQEHVDHYLIACTLTWRHREFWRQVRVFTIIENQDSGHVATNPVIPIEEEERNRQIDQFRADFYQCVRELSEIQRDTINAFLDGMTARLIAEKLGIPEGTVRRRLFRARKALYKCMAKKGYKRSQLIAV